MDTPFDIGLPPKFIAWRKGQEQAIRSLLFSPARFDGLLLPTGSGKTTVYMSFSAIDDGRAVFLTATRSLQDQLDGDFGGAEGMGLVDVRGRSNYDCNIDPRYTADTAPCSVGVYCPRTKGGGDGPCTFYDLLRKAEGSRLVSTNYPFWLHSERSGRLGYFRTVVCDEAHDAPDAISSFAAVEVTGEELHAFRVPPPPAQDRNAIGTWAPGAVGIIERGLGSVTGYALRRRGLDLQRKIARLCRLSENEWVRSRPDRRDHKEAWRWDLVDPGVLAEDLLFRGAQRVILVSASVRRKTFKLLGVKEKVKLIEQDSVFPVKRRPVYFIPVVKMNARTTLEDRKKLYRTMDEIIGARLDRKGLLHCVSYDRGVEVYRESVWRDRGVLLLHERRRELADVLREFRERDAPCVLVSPAITTGLNFPYREAEYQLIPKMPFPNPNDPLARARTSKDAEYAPYVTMQAVVQMTGRAMRAADDQCETFILDATFNWLRGCFSDFAPRYFHTAIRTVKTGDGDGVPKPPPAVDFGA